VPLTLAAAKAGKHVLCEKPIAMDAREAEQLREIPKGIVFYEAFMVRFHPQWHRVREIVRSGELGEVRAARGFFSYFNVDPANVRNQADIGGGGIMDIGCYPTVFSRYMFEAEPQRVVALVDRDATFKTDRQASVILDFGNGRQATFMCSTQLVGHQTVEVVGTKGRAEIKIPFNAPPDTPTVIEVDTGAALGGTLARREIIRPVDQYTEEAEAFALAVLGEKPLDYGVDDAIQNMKILDAMFASEKSGGWVNV
jgi:predicted dehydrogenase